MEVDQSLPSEDPDQGCQQAPKDESIAPANAGEARNGRPTESVVRALVPSRLWPVRISSNQQSRNALYYIISMMIRQRLH